MPRPVIGITSGSGGMPVAEGTLPSHYVGLGYSRSVRDAGGLPVVLPAVEGSEEPDAAEVIALLDGLLLAGGTDIHPMSYGQELDPARTQKPDPARDRFEIALVREARRRQIPILGICRGFQLLNVAYGGSLDQHRPHSGAAQVDHGDLRIETIELSVVEGSRLREVLGTDTLEVYCLHHQAIARVADGLRVSSAAGDGIIEGLEDPDAPFVVGVLWHPEQMAGSSDAERVYRSFVAAAQEEARVR